MAKYTITRSCGHEETVALIGPGSKREWRLEHVEPYKLCYECYQKDLQRRREEANKEAAETAKENRLPELTGTEKQVPWAETIRQRILADIDALIYAGNKREGRNELAIQEAYQAIRNKTTAHWWIDRRYIKGELELEGLLQKEYESLRVNTAAAPANEVAKDALTEATIRPKNPITETVAEIRILENVIEVKFPEKRDDFREVVKKELRMSWSDGSWKRELIYRNGKPEDRAAEAGHRLLATGFIIRIFDEKIRERAVAGGYEPECTNWIVTFNDDTEYAGRLGIRWDRGDDYYKAARRLPGSRWNKPYVVVRPEHYEEILDFAQMYSFKISKEARKLMDVAKIVKENTLIANVDPPVEREYASGLSIPPVLEVPKEVEIADEFKD